MAVTTVLMGIFLILLAPYLLIQGLNPALHSLVEAFQVEHPDGVWDTPVAILNVTFHMWMVILFFAGATLLVIAKDLYNGDKKVRAVTLAIMSMVAISGVATVIPWVVLVLPHGGGYPPTLTVMIIGLIGYFIVLLTEKSDWQMKVSQITVFSMLGIVGGYIYVNAQHGVRYFNGRPSAPFVESAESNPELFLGGYALYAASFLFPVAIGLLGMKSKRGWQLGVIAAIITFAAQLLAYIDRSVAGTASSKEWLEGALLSLLLIVILFVPFFKNRLVDKS
ncbi:MAG: hypothetical protein AB7V16_05880 [Vulcanibacillus sp.]